MARFPTHLIRIRDTHIQAWAHLAPQPVTGAGPLTNIPIGIKDIFDVAGMPTRHGSRLFADAGPAQEDSGLVAVLRNKGALIAGKTHTTSFAYFDSAPTRNPHRLSHTPGGSSSGSAAAVACGMVPYAVGSQTQGSVIRPASFCGVVGFKPTHGQLPLSGCLPFAPTLDTAGFFSANSLTMRWLWEALGYGARKFASLRVAAFRCPAEVEPEMRKTFERSVGKLGVAVVDPPTSYAGLYDLVKLIQDTEGGRTHEAVYRKHGDAVGAKFAAMIARGLATPETQYQAALGRLNEARAEFNGFFQQWDVVLTPAALGAAPEGFATTGDPRMNSPFTGLGTPAVTIPMPVGAGELPLGLQLAAARGRDAELLSAAVALEETLG